MPQGTPEHVPDDGLTTRQRRNRPLLIVHTGPGKGKSTAAFGLALRAWNQGWPVGVFQFVKSAKWRVGEERALRLLGETGQGGAVSWNKMGEGWSWIQRDAGGHAEQAAEGWAQIKRDLAAQTYRLYVLDEFTYPMKWGWVDVDEVISVLAARPGQQHVVITGRDADPRLTGAADLVTEMTKVKHPMDAGPEGPEGHRMVALPRLVIAAPASGCGKTTVACGLMAALRARGLAVSGHKVGPDYIDPGYHALATGRPPRNLDPFLCGEELIAPLFRHGAAGAQVAVVEGVMGLFDGVDEGGLGGLPPGRAPGDRPPGSTDFGSTAHVARLLGAPVVLVVDAARAGRSVAALAAGFAGFDPRTPVAGVILNQVASDRHERLLRDALAGTGLPVYGVIRRTEGIITPSRHLGLIPAAERAALAGQAIDRMGALIAASCDLDALLALAARATALPGPAWSPPPATGTHHPSPHDRDSRRRGLHLRLHRAGRTPRGGRRPGGPVRPAARRGPARGDGRADPRRRLPRDARGRPVRQRAAARPGRGAGRPGRAGRRRVRRACSTWPGRWTTGPCAASSTCGPR